MVFIPHHGSDHLRWDNARMPQFEEWFAQPEVRTLVGDARSIVNQKPAVGGSLLQFPLRCEGYLISTSTRRELIVSHARYALRVGIERWNLPPAALCRG